jgi:hypothetical protein
MVIFRVSPDELASVEKAAEESGARSISGYMRDSILGPRDQRMKGIHERLQGLEEGMEMMLKQLDKATEKWGHGLWA